MDNTLLHAFTLIAVFMAATYAMQRKSEFYTCRNFAKTWILFGSLATTTVAGYFAIYGASCLIASAGISDVVPGSPADIAGLRIGDRPLVGNKVGDWSSIEALVQDSNVGFVEFSVMRQMDGDLHESEVQMVYNEDQMFLRDLGIKLPIEYHTLSAIDVARATLNETSVGLALLAQFGLVAEQRYTTLIVDHESSGAAFVANIAHLIPLLFVGSLLGMAVVSSLQYLKPNWCRDSRYALKEDAGQEEIGEPTCISGIVVKVAS